MTPKRYYVRVRGRVIGPFGLPQLQSLRERGQFRAFHEVSEDKTIWMPASSILELFAGKALASSSAIESDTPPIDTLDQLPPNTSMAVSNEHSPRGLRSLVTGWRLIAFGLGLGALLLVSVLLLFMLRAPVINSVREDDLSGAVGLVVCGYKVANADGQFEYALSSGSCFAVSSEGHLLTNKHVVEKIWNETHTDFLWKKFREEKLIDVKPTVWIFLDKEKYVAEILHVSENYDLGILKIDRHHIPFFALSSSDKPSRGKKMLACGFPGAPAQIAVGEAEDFQDRIKKQFLQHSLHKNVQDYFKSRAFNFIMTGGVVSQTFADDGKGQMWIQHDATIQHGSSGGPLISENGIAFALNTWGAKDLKDPLASMVFLSLSTPQLRQDVDKHVPGAVWK